jgi:RecA/RadA recombinase
MAKNWLQKLQQHEGAVIERWNPHEHVLQTHSPSLNFMFGKGHGLPKSLTLALGGPPKGGKTLVSNMYAGMLHQQDPEAFVIKYNTEFREQGQATPEELQEVWGIDPLRYQPYEVNSPMHIFDHIEKDVAAYCQDGMPLGLVIIDSIDGIQGRRAMNADTIETQQIGDWALTLGEGFKRILPVQRKYRFAVILTCQIRSEMDLLEQKRGNKFKMKMPKAVEHYAEYFAYVEPNRNVEGRTAMDGSEFRSEIKSGVDEKNGEQTGHKIRVRMKDSSCGPKGRLAEFTLNYQRGIINTHEEVFKLAKNWGVFDVTGLTYSFGGSKWVGKPQVLEALASDRDLQRAVMAEVYRRDNGNDDVEVDSE